MKFAVNAIQRLFTISLLAVLMTTAAFAADDPDKDKSLPEIEKELAELAFQILHHDSTDLKFELNKQFIGKLSHVLKRPESYDYPWDSLETLSILEPEDNSFRIFTWHIVDKPKDEYYAELSHYYFGMIQRKFITKAGETQYLVIPLMEMDVIPKGFESQTTDNYAWFGALYYEPKHIGKIPQYESFIYKYDVSDQGQFKESDDEAWHITFSPGKQGARKVVRGKKLEYIPRKLTKEKITYYVMMGWNGWDNKSDYKVLEAMHFDPEDSMRVIFGAPIFYYEQIPKSRVMFKYSAYAPFSLNMEYVKKGLFGWGKELMIVYDHMAQPNMTEGTEMWEMGPDGSYDALYFYKKGASFEWKRDVELATEYNSKYNEKQIKKLRKEEMKKMKDAGIELQTKSE